MRPKDRQKICTHCDGRIPYESDRCPYCGAEASRSVEPGKETHHRSLQDSLTAPYAPSPARPAQAPIFEKKSLPSQPSVQAAVAEAPSSANEGKKAFLPLLLLALAGNLMTIGILLLLFAEDGVLRLEWDAGNWFIYCLCALPLFFFGLKKASSLNE